MLFLLQEGHNLLLGGPDGFIGNSINQIRNAKLFAAFEEPLFEFLFEHLGHPHHTLKPPVTNNELAPGNDYASFCLVWCTLANVRLAHIPCLNVAYDNFLK